MRSPSLLASFALTALAAAVGLARPHAAAAQTTDYYLRAGVSGATALVRDAIRTELHVEQGIAPALALGVGLPLGTRYRAGVELGATIGGLTATETNEADRDLGSVRTASALAYLEGGLFPGVRWRGGLGGITYGGGDAAMFDGGSGVRLLAGGALDWRRPALASADLTVSLRYDFHRFTTAALRARGFGGAQGVSRVALTVGLARGAR
jgi:hypothetical protein